jgi:hypothetical protein
MSAIIGRAPLEHPRGHAPSRELGIDQKPAASSASIATRVMVSHDADERITERYPDEAG